MKQYLKISLLKLRFRTIRVWTILASLTLCFIILSFILTLAVKRAKNTMISKESDWKAQSTQHLYNKNKLLLTVNMDNGRLGDKMFKYASLLGIANSTGRRPFVPPRSKNMQGNLTNSFKMTCVEHHEPEFFQGFKDVSEPGWRRWGSIFKDLPDVNVKINGFLQSWKYFYNIRDEIRREFTFQPIVRVQANAILDVIRETFFDKDDLIFIGVHVRRYSTSSSQKTDGLPLSYYEKAFERMETILPGKHLVYVVACLDTNWCKSNLHHRDFALLPDASPVVHLAVLASCEHVIISDGTFGWWAGWLSGGHVIYYNTFQDRGQSNYHGFIADDYYPPTWLEVY